MIVDVVVVPHGVVAYRPGGAWGFARYDHGVLVEKLGSPQTTLWGAFQQLTKEAQGNLADFVITEVRRDGKLLYTARTSEASELNPTTSRTFATPHEGSSD
jgi:streptogramin lyase